MIQVNGLTKRFGHIKAVSSLTFAAEDASITGLLGVNGAGKTTTLRIIAGVLKPDAGCTYIGGVSPQADAVAAQRDLGVLLDHTGLYPRLTPRENLRYFARLRGVSHETIEVRIERVLDDLRLGRLADRPVSGFSQGEHMKVAIGRALVHGPGHILLDEPTNGLDVPTVRILRQLLKNLRDSRACIVFSSHVLSEVEDLCDRIVVVANGTVAGYGSAAALCSETRTSSLEDAFLKLTGEEEGI